MPVTRILIQAAILLGVSGTFARGDAMLTLGIFSSDSTGGGSGSSNLVSNTTYSGNGFTLFQATAPAAPSVPTVLPSQNTQNLASAETTVQPAPVYAPAPVASPSPASVAPQPAYDAFVNLGSGPFSDPTGLTTGNAKPWYDSPSITRLFGGQPTSQQVASFDSTVLQRVENTFQLSGVPVKLTDDPNASAAHTLSVVSNTINPNMTGAIGMTNLGGNGFHFIDNSAAYAQSVDQLEWVVAHNVAHELMLAFGVPEVHDQSGQYIDSTTAHLAAFLNPSATFSSGATQALLAQDFQDTNTSVFSASPQLIDGTPVPEPTTVALWGFGAIGLVMARRSRKARPSA